jgi:hypothetical protein
MATGCFYQADFAQTNFIQPCLVPDVQPSGGGGGHGKAGVGAWRRQHVNLYERPRNVWDEHQKRQQAVEARQELLRKPAPETKKQPEKPKRVVAEQPAAIEALVTPVAPLVDIAVFEEQRRQQQIKDRQRLIDEMRQQAEEAAARQLLLDNDAAAFMLLLD